MFVVAVAESCAGHRVTGVQQVVQCGVEVVGGDLQTVVLGLMFSVGGYDRCAAKQLTTRARVQALTRSDSQTRQRGLLNVPDVDGRQVDHYCLLGIRRSGSAMAVTRNGRHIRCPVCGSDAFEQRHWTSMVRGAQLSRNAPMQLFALRNQVEWYVCEECRYVLPFLAD